MKLSNIRRFESLLLSEATNLRFGPAEFATIMALENPIKSAKLAGSSFRLPLVARRAYSNLLDQLWANKTPSQEPEDLQTYTRIKAGIGPDRFSLYCRDDAAYIAQWQKGQQFWYRTGVFA